MLSHPVSVGRVVCSGLWSRKHIVTSANKNGSHERWSKIVMKMTWKKALSASLLLLFRLKTNNLHFLFAENWRRRCSEAQGTSHTFPERRYCGNSERTQLLLCVAKTPTHVHIHVYIVLCFCRSQHKRRTTPWCVTRAAPRETRKAHRSLTPMSSL